MNGLASGPILVAGAGGQVGLALARHRKMANRPVVLLARKDLDIADADMVRASVKRYGPSIVINVAAYTAVDKAEREQDLAFAVNRDGTGNLAAACATARIPLIHVSTDYVFDGEKTGAYLESDPVGPIGIYGASKLAGEEVLRQRLAEHVILRTAWVFSADGANFVRTMLRLSAERPELRVVADQCGGPTSADSIAEALLAIAERLGASSERWGTYHFCGAPATSWYEFARAIVEEAARHRGRLVSVTPITTAEYPTPARRPRNSVLDCGTIRAAFGIAQPDWRVSLPPVVKAIVGEEVRQ